MERALADSAAAGEARGKDLSGFTPRRPDTGPIRPYDVQERRTRSRWGPLATGYFAVSSLGDYPHSKGAWRRLSHQGDDPKALR